MADDGRYRLAPVREVRARTEAIRRSDLASAVGDARETEVRVQTLHTRTDAARAALCEALATRDRWTSNVATSTQLVLADRYVARRRRDVIAALEEELRAAQAHDERQGVVELARATLTRAHGERELIERHFARWRAERAKLVDRRED